MIFFGKPVPTFPDHARKNRERPMSNAAATAHLQQALQPAMNDPQEFLRLGMMCSTGMSGAADMVAAHKWFNIAAMRGNTEAARLRREVADEMSEGEIAAAQRAARDWITRH
jgi:uncharacterized protein